MSNIKYLAIFLFCIFLLFLCSCSAEYHMSQARKKKPELFQVDTIRIHDTVYVELPIADTAQLDSLLALLLAEDSLVTSQSHKDSNSISKLQRNPVAQSHKKHIAKQIKELYKDKPCIPFGDTLKYNINDTFMVNVWQVGNKLGISHYKLITTEKAIITEGKTPAWKNYLLIAGWILVAVLFLLALIRR